MQDNKSGSKDISQIHSSTAIFYQGNLPHPDIMLGFKNVNPEMPERILAMTEKNNDATIELNREMLHGENDFRRRGQWLTVLLFILVLAVTLFFGLMGMEGGAIATVIAGFGAIAVAAFKTVSGKD
ncbi:MAG: hypothetical protein LBB36_04045 [Fibromonadaceae bacterium]|jgi:uncharacterized membrane protein|nr:hypothetical protein [Fibromonadaceae bacterium]